MLEWALADPLKTRFVIIYAAAIYGTRENLELFFWLNTVVPSRQGTSIAAYAKAPTFKRTNARKVSEKTEPSTSKYVKELT
jgi:hypothetical protein